MVDDAELSQLARRILHPHSWTARSPGSAIVKSVFRAVASRRHRPKTTRQLAALLGCDTRTAQKVLAGIERALLPLVGVPGDEELAQGVCEVLLAEQAEGTSSPDETRQHLAALYATIRRAKTALVLPKREERGRVVREAAVRLSVEREAYADAWRKYLRERGSP